MLKRQQTTKSHWHARLAFVLTIAFAFVSLAFTDLPAANASDLTSQANESAFLDAQYMAQMVPLGGSPTAIPADTTAGKLVIKTATTKNTVKHTAYKTYTKKVAARTCKYLNWGLVHVGHKKALPCVSKTKITHVWYTQASGKPVVPRSVSPLSFGISEVIPGCSIPYSLGFVTDEVSSIAWKVTATAYYLAEPICDTVSWLFVSCKVNYSFGWDVQFNNCASATGITPTYYQATFFIAEWRTNFISSIIPIQFGFCYKGSVDPQTHKPWNLDAC